MSDWEDMLDSDTEIEIKKEGQEKFEEEEKVKEKEAQKPLPKVEKVRVKVEPKKKIEKRELTEAEKEKIKKQIEEQQAQDIKDFFGDATEQNLDGITLTNEAQFKEFSNLVHSKINKAESRSYIITFMNELITKVSNDLRVEDLQKVQSKLKVIINTKQKEKKKKKEGKKKKKKNKGPVLKGISKEGKDYTMNNDDLYGTFKDNDFDEENYNEDDYDYRGKDEDYDFM